MPPARRDLQLRQLQRAASKPKLVKPKPKPKPKEACKTLIDLPSDCLSRVVAMLASVEDVGRMDCVSKLFHAPYSEDTASSTPSVVEQGLRLRLFARTSNPPAATFASTTRGPRRDVCVETSSWWTQKLCWDERRRRRDAEQGSVPVLACGAMHSAFVDSSRSLLTCGVYHASVGFLGFGPDIFVVNTPTAVPSLSRVTALSVSAGSHHTLVLGDEEAVEAEEGVYEKDGGGSRAPTTTRGVVYACGRGDCGRLGNGSTCDHEYTPVPIEAVRGVRVCGVAAGRDHSLLCDEHGCAWSFGSDANGQLGRGASPTRSYLSGAYNDEEDEEDEEEDEDEDADHEESAARNGHSAYGRPPLARSGRYGRRGRRRVISSATPIPVDDRGAISSATPIPVDDLRGVRVLGVSAGHDSSYFLIEDGSVRSCGLGDHGQLGHGATYNRPLPGPVRFPGTPNARIRRIAAGRAHCLFVDRNGGAHSCGLGTFGRLGHGDDATQLSPRLITAGALAQLSTRDAAAGEAHSLFVTADGGLVSCGWNVSGQCGTGHLTLEVLSPQLVSGLAAVAVRGAAAGYAHSLAYDADGRVYGFGNGADECLGLRLRSDLPTPREYSQLRVAVSSGGADQARREAEAAELCALSA